MLQTADQNWNHIGAPELTHCRVRFTQIPGGEVINVEFTSCPYDAQGREFVDRALRKTPMPYSGFEDVFLRKVELTFCYPERGMHPMKRLLLLVLMLLPAADAAGPGPRHRPGFGQRGLAADRGRADALPGQQCAPGHRRGRGDPQRPQPLRPVPFAAGRQACRASRLAAARSTSPTWRLLQAGLHRRRPHRSTPPTAATASSTSCTTSPSSERLLGLPIRGRAKAMRDVGAPDRRRDLREDPRRPRRVLDPDRLRHRRRPGPGHAATR